MDTYGLVLYHMMKKKAFFSRFPKEVLLENLGNAKVEYFKEKDIVFLKKRVGVITHGSVMVRSHNDIMEPVLLGRMREGSIIGHGVGDNFITLQSHTWIICYDPGTEIVFFDKKVFDKLWSLQYMNTDLMIMLSKLQNNNFFQHLNPQTLMTFVFDSLKIVKLQPGQCIFRMSKDSPHNINYFQEFYRDGMNSFLLHLEN